RLRLTGARSTSRVPTALRRPPAPSLVWRTHRSSRGAIRFSRGHCCSPSQLDAVARTPRATGGSHPDDSCGVLLTLILSTKRLGWRVESRRVNTFGSPTDNRAEEAGRSHLLVSRALK
ncbi:hypothetical protein H1C71_008997, partial [Ictidomys tridecemlineatus]